VAVRLASTAIYVVVMSILILILARSRFSHATDIFPNINIPVSASSGPISLVLRTWPTIVALRAERYTTLIISRRRIAIVVWNAVVKVFCTTRTSNKHAQITAVSQTQLKQLPADHPLSFLPISASSVPFSSALSGKNFGATAQRLWPEFYRRSSSPCLAHLCPIPMV